MPADWVPHAVFYALNPDRFARGTPPSSPGWDATAFEDWDAPPRHKAYKGGNLYGVIEKLDYLQDLGINALYLTPIFTSPTHHRYKTIDYYHVDPLLGGNAAFKALRKETHHRGIRLVLDGVFNHVGAGFPRFQDLLEYGTSSPWRKWFHTEKWPDYKCWNNNKTMPTLNYANPHVREYILKVAEYWVEQGIDGWRLDAPQEINWPGFWQKMRERLTRINHEVYLLGEIWTEARLWLDGTQWHGVTNYPLMGAIHRFTAGARIRNEHLLAGSPPVAPLDAPGFRREYEGLLLQYSWDIQLRQFNFLGTHDTARFRSLCGEDERTVELATSMLIALPGAPCIYYGDEIGMAGGVPPASRAGFPEKPRNLLSLDYHRRLMNLRNTHASLRTGTITIMDAKDHVLTLQRKTDTEKIIVALNAGDVPERVHIGAVRRSLYGDVACESGYALVPARSAAFWEV